MQRRELLKYTAQVTIGATAVSGSSGAVSTSTELSRLDLPDTVETSMVIATAEFNPDSDIWPHLDEWLEHNPDFEEDQHESSYSGNTRSDGGLVTVYESGSVIIRGDDVTGVEKSHQALEKRSRRAGLSADSGPENLTINNVVANGSLGKTVELDELKNELETETTTEVKAEIGPSLTYHPQSFSANVLVFPNGMMTFRSAINEEEVATLHRRVTSAAEAI